jgi:hypothetical protein
MSSSSSAGLPQDHAHSRPGPPRILKCHADATKWLADGGAELALPAGLYKGWPIVVRLT